MSGTFLVMLSSTVFFPYVLLGRVREGSGPPSFLTSGVEKLLFGVDKLLCLVEVCLVVVSKKITVISFVKAF